jgi:hypothetical protein
MVSLNKQNHIRQPFELFTPYAKLEAADSKLMEPGLLGNPVAEVIWCGRMANGGTSAERRQWPPVLVIKL